MRESASSNPTAAAIDIHRLPWIRRLAADYSTSFDGLAPFYAGNPNDPLAWRDRIAEVQAQARDREAVADLLKRQSERRGAARAALDAIEQLRDPRTIAVVTGQQAGVIGGPLFTLLKALTALRLAKWVERQHKTPAVAVFWIDAEDHDWNEIASATVLDAEYGTQHLTLPPPPRANEVPVATVTLDQHVTEFLSQLRAALPPTEFTNEILDQLAQAYTPGTRIVDAFATWVDRVLGSRGLILFDCSDRAAKPLVSRVFAHELSHPGRTWQLASDAGAALTAQGYHQQVESHSDGVALFHIEDGRQPIRREGADFVVGSRRVAAADLVRAAQTNPEQFSPNVLLRPLVQDVLFPTVAYVAGPSELAYHGQLKEVYAHFGVPMPLLVPRATATLLDSAAARFLGRYDIPFSELQQQDEAGLNRLLASQLPPQVESAMEDAQHAVAQRMAAVIAALPSLDPTLEGAARATLGRMEHELRTLQSKVIHAAKKRDDTLRRQFVRTRALVFPDGHAQERTLGFVWFLNRYGPALVDILERDLPRDGAVHALLTP